MDTPSHQEDERQIRRYKTIMTVILFVTDCFQIYLGWMVESEGDDDDKSLFQGTQLILLLVLSGCYVKNLFHKYYPGPAVAENRRALQWYRFLMFFFLLGIDFAQLWLSVWPLEDTRLNAEIQLGLLGLLNFLYVLNFFVNQGVATSGNGNDKTNIKGKTGRFPEELVTVKV